MPVTLSRLKVMSYNVQGHAALVSRTYLERIARVIREAEPDVVGLQEVYRRSWRSRFEDQAETLARLTGMAVEFGPSFAGRGGEFGNAVLVAGEVRSAEVVRLPGGGEPRTLLHSRIALESGELDFLVTHLSAWGPLGSMARSRQAAQLVERLRGCGGPFVLVGDLNAPPAAPELRHLLAAELFRSCGDHLEVTHRMTRQRIDYVFADPGWHTTATRVLRAGPSDHWPVVVELARAGSGHNSERASGHASGHASMGSTG